MRPSSKWFWLFCLLALFSAAALPQTPTDRAMPTPESPNSHGTSLFRSEKQALALRTVPAVALAQTAGPGQSGSPKGEVFAGLSYSNLSILGFASRRHSVGWGTSITGKLGRYFGLTADFGGQYDPECPDQDIQCFVELLRANEIHDYSSHQFLAGPRLMIPGHRADVFFHGLFGGVRTSASILNVASGIRTRTTSGPNFAMAFGGGVDWNLGDRVAIRVVQLDYIPVRESTLWRHNIRLQGGIVYRFGS